jgi:hypothetical protein
MIIEIMLRRLLLTTFAGHEKCRLLLQVHVSERIASLPLSSIPVHCQPRTRQGVHISRTSQCKEPDEGTPEELNVLKTDADGAAKVGTRFAANAACVLAPRQRHVGQEHISPRTNKRMNDTKALVPDPFLRWPGTLQFSQQVREYTCTIDSPTISSVQPVK